MVAEAEIMCPKSIPMRDVKYHLCVEQEHSVKVEVSPTSPVPIFAQAACSEIVQDSILETPVIEFVPNVRSGSYAEIGQRESMDDEHLRIDDLAAHLGFVFKYPIPSAFYAVFDGHGGPEAAAFVKRNAMRLFFEDADMLQSYDTDAFFLKKLEDTHRRAFRRADLALAAEQSVGGYCGTTALTALVLGKHLMVANAGDCRAVLCRRGTAVAMSQDHRPSYLPEQRRVEKLDGVIVDGYLNGELSVTRALGDWEFKRGTAVAMSQDHRPSYLPEQRRVEELGGFIVDGYLNGDLSVACALGDWEFKLPLGIASPLTAEPDVQLVELTEDDEFLIIGCDGIWDVMTSQVAVSLVRRGLRRHGDPQQCARELVKEALRLYTSDNLTVIVICLSSIQSIIDSCSPRRRRFKACSLSEEACNRLKSEME